MSKNITLTIIDPVGLHARPASLVVQTANEFNSDIKILFNGNEGNLKSIMNVMAMQVTQNSKIEIVAKGSDEEEAISKIETVMKSNNLI